LERAGTDEAGLDGWKLETYTWPEGELIAKKNEGGGWYKDGNFLGESARSVVKNEQLGFRRL